MRNIAEIERDIRKVSDLLNRLILERKLTIQFLNGIEASSEELAKRAIKKMKEKA